MAVSSIAVIIDIARMLCRSTPINWYAHLTKNGPRTAPTPPLKTTDHTNPSCQDWWPATRHGDRPPYFLLPVPKGDAAPLIEVYPVMSEGVQGGSPREFELPRDMFTRSVDKFAVGKPSLQ